VIRHSSSVQSRRSSIQEKRLRALQLSTNKTGPTSQFFRRRAARNLLDTAGPRLPRFDYGAHCRRVVPPAALLRCTSHWHTPRGFGVALRLYYWGGTRATH
jgi:hypothetical protein